MFWDLFIRRVFATLGDSLWNLAAAAGPRGAPPVARSAWHKLDVVSLSVLRLCFPAEHPMRCAAEQAIAGATGPPSGRDDLLRRLTSLAGLDEQWVLRQRGLVEGRRCRWRASNGRPSASQHVPHAIADCRGVGAPGFRTASLGARRWLVPRSSQRASASELCSFPPRSRRTRRDARGRSEPGSRLVHPDGRTGAAISVRLRRGLAGVAGCFVSFVLCRLDRRTDLRCGSRRSGIPSRKWLNNSKKRM